MGIKKGFTLIEICMVLTTIGILVSLGLTYGVRLLDWSKIQVTLKNLESFGVATLNCAAEMGIPQTTVNVVVSHNYFPKSQTLYHKPYVINSFTENFVIVSTQIPSGSYQGGQGVAISVVSGNEWDTVFMTITRKQLNREPQLEKKWLEDSTAGQFPVTAIANPTPT